MGVVFRFAGQFGVTAIQCIGFPQREDANCIRVLCQQLPGLLAGDAPQVAGAATWQRLHGNGQRFGGRGAALQQDTQTFGFVFGLQAGLLHNMVFGLLQAEPAIEANDGGKADKNQQAGTDQQFALDTVWHGASLFNIFYIINKTRADWQCLSILLAFKLHKKPVL